MAKIDVILLAGAPVDDGLECAEGYSSRAMVLLGGKTMLAWVVDALKASPSIGQIVAIGDVTGDGIDQVIPPGGNIVENIGLGMKALGSEGRVLIVCSDIPLLTAEAVEDFLAKATDMDVDLAYPVAKKERCLELYPQFKRTYLKTADGTFTGGNIMLVSTKFIKENLHVIQNAYMARKDILALARIIGFGVLIRVIVGQVCPRLLKLVVLEDAASKILNARLKAVISNYPEIGEDVDKAEDVKEASLILTQSYTKSVG